MTDESSKNSPYHADQDAAPFQNALTRWAHFGFVAGVCGVRPTFFGDLPSSVFYNSFLDQLLCVEPSSDEVRLRIDYGDQMQGRLFKFEDDAYETRERLEKWGIVARTAIVILLMASICGLIATGYQNIGIGIFLSMIAVGLVIPRIAGRRDRGLTAVAFMPDRIRMPWMLSSPANESTART